MQRRSSPGVPTTMVEATDKVLLCSFPKSGSNWVRYCIEHFSGRPTPGSERSLLVRDGEPLIDRTHFLDKRDRAAFTGHKLRRGKAPTAAQPRAWLPAALTRWRKERRLAGLAASRRVILLLRSPYELYVRVRATGLEAMAGYASNILVFERCRRDKLLVYYEDMVADIGEIGRILTFLGVPADLAEFDVAAHRRRSLELYAQGVDAPETAADPMDVTRHSRSLPPGTRAALRSFLLGRLGADVFARYLGRYETPADMAAAAP